MSDLLELLERAPAKRGPDVPATFGPMLDDVMRAFGADRAVIALYEPERKVLRSALGRNVPADLVEALQIADTERTDPLVTALRTGVPQSVTDTATDARLGQHTRNVLLELGFEQFVVAPLHGDSESLGVLVLSRKAPIAESEMDALLPVAERAGTELQRARDVVRLRGASEQGAVEREWLWWMINAVSDPVVVSDEQNQLVLQNTTAEKLFRSSPDDTPGKAHAVTMNNVLFTAALSTWNLQRGESSRPREMTLVDPLEGSDVIFEVIAIPATNYRAGQRGMVCVLKNVTELRLVSEELTRNIERVRSADVEVRVERDRLDLILRSVPNPIIVIDSDELTVSMNQAAQRIFGSPSQRLDPAAGLSPHEEAALRNSAKLTSFLAQLRLDPGVRKTGELQLQDPETDEKLEMAVVSTEILDDRGVPIATVTVMQDVGRYRELERRRLEQALFDSEKLAATGRLAASIAHEINNPLEAIQNSLYLLVNKIPKDNENHKFLEIAMRETERMSRILRQMLGFYRPAAAMAPTDLNALVEEAEALVAKRLKDRRVRLVKDLDGETPPIMASADQLKQVILNLLLNASEAMPQGGTITVSTDVHRDAGQRFIRSGSVLLQIRDDGVGIPDEHMAHLFEPFFSTKGEKGTGLGLWVSYGIVQAHGGTLQVRSREGQGTTFSITLPIGGPPTDAG